MASTAEKIIRGNAKAFNKLRKHFFKLNGEQSRCFLLRKVGQTAEFDLLMEVEKDWYLKYEQARAQSNLKVARLDEEFIEAFEQMTDYAITDSKGVGKVYEVDNRDKEEPKGSAFYYQMFGVKTLNKFLPEEAS